MSILRLKVLQTRRLQPNKFEQSFLTKQNQEKQLAELNAKLQEEYDREAAKLKAKSPVNKNPVANELEEDIKG